MKTWNLLVRLVQWHVWLFVGMAIWPNFAWGHAVLIESNPPNHATLYKAPQTFLLKFNAALEEVITRVYLIDPEKHQTPLEKVAETKSDQVVVRLPPLSPGVYTILYKVLARDGHVTEGRVQFTFLGP